MNYATIAAGNPLEFLTQFGVEWRLLISQGVSFAIVATALYYFVFKPVIAVSQKRTAEIEQGLKDAEAARARLADAENEAKAQLQKTALEASQILERARDSAKKTVEDAAAEAARKAAQMRENAERQIALDKAQMKRELKEELSELVVKAAEATVSEVLTDEQRGKLAEIAAEKLSREN